MIPTQQLETFQTFAETGSKSKPEAAKYAAGFVPADVLPAEWENWLWNKASASISKHATGLASVEAELNNVVGAGGGTPSESTNNQVLNAIKYLIAQAKTEAIDDAHPVGSIELRADSTNPGTLYGGTWVQISQGRVLVGAGTGTDSNSKSKSFTAGETGGEYDHTLTEKEMPAHTHLFFGTAHTHTFTGSSATTSSQSSSTTGNESAHEKFSWTGSHRHDFRKVEMQSSESPTKVNYHYFDIQVKDTYPYSVALKNNTFTTTSSQWAVTSYGQVFTEQFGFNQSGNTVDAPYLGFKAPWVISSTSGYPPSRALHPIQVADKSIAVSGTCTGDHTHSYAHTHNLTAKGTNADTTAGGSNSNTGESKSHNNIQPYLVCYIWKRTA